MEEHGTLDAAPASPATAATRAAPSEWLFLSEWFRILSDADISVQSGSHGRDAIRIGGDEDDGDAEADLWLNATMSRGYLEDDDAYESDEDDDDTLDNRWPLSATAQERVARLRDAIVLTSIVGKVDNEGWLEMTKAFTTMLHMQLSIRAALGRTARSIPIRFLFLFGANHNKHFLKWSNCLGGLMGDLHHSDAYFQDLETVQSKLMRRGISWLDVEPTPVKLCLSIDRGDVSSYDLSRRLTQIVNGIHHTERLVEEAQRSKTSRGVLFRVAEMDISFSHILAHDRVIEAMTNLLHTGVRVSKFKLPQLNNYDQPNIQVWGPFMRLLMGVEPDDQGRLVSARCIEAGSFVRRPHFALLCSALAYARGVEALILPFHWENGTFGATETERSRVWRWLTFALFSKASTTSVTNLCILGERPTRSDIPVIKEIVESENPFHVMSVSAGEYEDDFPRLDPLFQTAVRTFRPRAIFRVSNGTTTHECFNVKEMAGEVLSEPNDAGERVVFIPGYGLCWGQLSDRPGKRTRTEPLKERVVSSCDHLVIGALEIRTMEPECLLELLRIVGMRLRALKFSVESDDAMLARVFELCPNLESLHTHQLRLSSLEVVLQAYANGSKVSSLNLDVTSVAETELHEFVRLFLLKHPAKTTAAFHVKRLEVDFGQHVSKTATIELLEKVLAENEALTHFFGRPSISTEKPHRLNGKRVPDVAAKENVQLLAFLIGMTNRALHLDDHIKQLIYDFAATPRYRRVRW